MKILLTKTITLFSISILLTFFTDCSKKNSSKPRSFVRLEVDGRVYEYFDFDFSGNHFFDNFATTRGNLYDTSSSNLNGRPAFFISYSGPTGQKEGDFWMTWGSYSPDNSTTNYWRTVSGDPNERKFTVDQISSDHLKWSGSFYYDAENLSGNHKIVKGTYSIVD